MAKPKIVKRKRTPGEMVDALTTIPGSVRLWWQRISKLRVYREVFWPALWGEMGEYEIRFSTIAWCVLYPIAAITGFTFLSTSVFFVKTKFCIFVGMILVGLYMLKDLQGPLWWADHFAIKAYDDYRQTGQYRPYSRYSAYFRQQVQRNPATLRLEEMVFLCELYHQLCTGTISEMALRELGVYTAQEITAFYQFFDIRQGDPLFPPQYIGYRLTQQPPQP